MSDSTLSPTDNDLHAVAVSLREENPTLGLAKLLSQLKIDHSTWAVSEKRLKKFLPPATATTFTSSSATSGPASKTGVKSEKKVNGHEAQDQNGNATSTSSSTKDGLRDSTTMTNSAGEKSLIAATGLDTSLDVATIAPKVKVKMFQGGKGKGLVAKEKLLGGEMIWQEEPWVVVPDPGLYPYLTDRQMCSQCFNLFAQPSPPLSVPCKSCAEAHFCTRLCYSKAHSSGGHHDLLCPGQNKGIESLSSFIRKKKTRSVDAVARIIALWRGEREWGNKERAEQIQQRVWNGMARISQKDKEAERREWEYVGGPRIEEWQTTHRLLLKSLNPGPKDENYKPFQKLLTSKKRSKPTPLTSEEEERWFSFDSFLQLLGLVGLNQEDSGGLYALHAHLNHSCEPNVQVRNLPKGWTAPSPSDLPAELPPPMNASNRGTNKLTMLARKTIHPGDELVISYVDQRLSRDERRTQLREGYGFWCVCTRCERERREEVKALAKVKAKEHKKKEAEQQIKGNEPVDGKKAEEPVLEKKEEAHQDDPREATSQADNNTNANTTTDSSSGVSETVAANISNEATEEKEIDAQDEDEVDDLLL